MQRRPLLRSTIQVSSVQSDGGHNADGGMLQVSSSLGDGDGRCSYRIVVVVVAVAIDLVVVIKTDPGDDIKIALVPVMVVLGVINWVVGLEIDGRDEFDLTVQILSPYLIF
ncbi:hypothetical protein Tco_1299913 [Tanacetum coccineum]